MNWTDIASIVFVCVTANHLGLIGAVENIIGKRLPIVNCPKCLSFWVTLGYGCYNIAADWTVVLAISFLASYSALWLELLEGFIDTLYTKIYDKIYPNTTDDKAASDENGDDTGGSLSDL